MTSIIQTQAGTLSRLLASITDDLDRDLHVASILRTLAAAVDGDAANVLVDAAGDIEGDVFDRAERITTAGGPTRQWYVEHSDGYWKACDMMHEQIKQLGRRAA